MKIIWQKEDMMQFRQAQSVGDKRFLLSGGLSCPTWPQSQLYCAIAIIDAESGDYVWKFEKKSHQRFEFGCATSTEAFGAIPNLYKSDFCGIMRFNLIDGTLLEPSIEVAGIKGLVSSVDSTLSYVTSGKTSVLVTRREMDSIQMMLPQGVAFSVAGLLALPPNLLLSVQQTLLINGKAKIIFAHQMRTLEGEILWEHRSDNETVVKLDDNRLMTFDNASDKKRPKVEILDSATGEVQETFSFPMSFANPVALEHGKILLCSPEYELCVFDLSNRTTTDRFAFPKDCPGWLCSAVDFSSRIIVGCKANNFMSPMSTIAAFEF